MWTYINTIYTSSFFTCKVRGFISNELFVYCVVSCLIIKCVICYTPTGVHFTSTCLIYDQLYLTIIPILQEMCKGIPPNTFIFSIQSPCSRLQLIWLIAHQRRIQLIIIKSLPYTLFEKRRVAFLRELNNTSDFSFQKFIWSAP